MTYGELTLKQVSDICNTHDCGSCPLEILCDGTGCFEPRKVPTNKELEFDKKYVCLDCRKTFDDPYRWEDRVGDYWGQPAYETHYSCPYCHSDEIVTEEEVLNGECDL